MTENWKAWEGQVLDGKFSLRQYLGGSPHSAVFLTEYGAGEPRPAAIKLIPVEAGEARQRLRQVEEAALLSHPRLLRIFQAGLCEHEGCPLLYVVMENAPEDLSQVLPQRALTEAETREVLTSVLEGLEYLHARGFVHGHLQPSNILAVDDQVRISSDGLQPAGEDPGRTPAADVRALGMTLVECLTQHRPDDILQTLETLPPRFREIVRHSFEPEVQRWTVGQIAAYLKPVTLPVTVAAKKLPAARPAGPWYQSPEARLAAGVVLLLLVGYAVFHRPPRPEPPAAVPSASVAAQEPPSGPAATKTEETPRPSPFSGKKAARTGEASRLVPESTPSPAAPVLQGTPDAAASPVADRNGVVHRVLPDVSGRAQSTIRGKVRVQIAVQVDPAGNVVLAEAESPGNSRYFEQLALNAARGWKFAPVEGGAESERTWMLRFDFRRSGVEVQPRRVNR